MKKCPFCGKEIKAAAIKCRFCGEILTSDDAASVNKKKKCPFCSEEISESAKKCPICNSDLSDSVKSKLVKFIHVKLASLLEKTKLFTQYLMRKNNSLLDRFSKGDSNRKKKLWLTECGLLAVVVIALFSWICFGGEHFEKGNFSQGRSGYQRQEYEDEHVEKINLPPGRPDYQLLEYTELGDLRAVKHLIVNLKANPNGAQYAQSGETPLFVAVKNKFNDIADYLIKKGANVNTKNSEGISVLLFALASEQYEIADLLLSEKAEKPLGAVIMAVNNNNIPLLKYLLKNKFKVNVVNDRAETPLMLAAEKQNVEMVKLLLKAGADVNFISKQGRAAIHAAVDPSRNGSSQEMYFYTNDKTDFHIALLILKELADAGADLNLKTGEGLPLTSLTMDADILKYLLEKHAEPIHLKDDCRLSKLDLIKKTPYIETAKLLIKAGSNVNAKGRDCGVLPLEFAAQKGDLELMKLLLENGAKADYCSLINNALEKKQFDFCAYLLKLGKTTLTDVEIYLMRSIPSGSKLFYIYLTHGGKILKAQELEYGLVIPDIVPKDKNNNLLPMSEEWEKTILNSLSKITAERIFTAVGKKQFNLALKMLNKYTPPQKQVYGVSSVDEDCDVFIEMLGKKVLEEENIPCIEKMLSMNLLKSVDGLSSRCKPETTLCILTHARGTLQNSLLCKAVEDSKEKDVSILMANGADPTYEPGVHVRGYRQSVYEIAVALKRKHDSQYYDSFQDKKSVSTEERIVSILGKKIPKNYVLNRQLTFELQNGMLLGNDWTPAVADELRYEGAELNTPANQFLLVWAFDSPGCCNNLIKYLIKNKIGINTRDENMPPLLYAVRNESYRDYVDPLLKAGADVNARDSKGQTILHYAVRKLGVNFLKSIMPYNPDMTIKDNEGKVPMDYADPETVKFLEEFRDKKQK